MARRIDHLVVAVHDLDRATDFYRRLGFRPGVRNIHPWGTENRLVQMRSAFIELIAIGKDVASIRPHTMRFFSFGAFVRGFLDRREGLAMLVLDSDDAKADAARFEREGIGSFTPLYLQRKGSTPDGNEIDVAFTLAFAHTFEAPLTGFFVCQHQTPEQFWNPLFQSHPNGATGLGAVTFAAAEPERFRRFLLAFTDGDPTHQTRDNLTFRLSDSDLAVVTPHDAAALYGPVEAEPDEPSFAGYSVVVEDLPAQARRLDAEGIPFREIGSRMVVPASAAFGVAIAFEAP